MKKMGCGCDLGCECKKFLGQIEAATGMNPWWFLAGAVGGVALYYVAKNAASPGTGPGTESMMPVPSKVAPSGYASLQAVSDRFKQVEELYHRGDFTAEQTVAELDGLVQRANTFSLYDGEQVTQVVADIKNLQDKARDMIQFRRDNPSIPGYAQPTPVTNVAPGFQAYG
jgi:hypothetical protein